MARMIKTTQAMTLGVKFTTVFEDGTTAEHVFKAGDTINDLRYVLDGEVETVSGRLASIQYTTATKITWNKNNPSNSMMNDITLTNLVIDNSEQYHASTVEVPMVEVVEWADEKNVARVKYEPFATYDITMHYSDLTSNTVSVEVGDKFDKAQFFNPSDPEHLIEGTFVVVGFAYKLANRAIQVTGIAFQAEDGTYQVVDFENIFRLNEIYTYKVDSPETFKSKISELANGDTLSITAEIDNSTSGSAIVISDKNIDLNLIADIKTANSSDSIVMFTNTKSTISGSGKFVSTTPYDRAHSTGVIAISEGADVTFNGSGVNTVIGPDEGTFGISVKDNAIITVNDGEFKSSWQNFAMNGSNQSQTAVLTINGGSLESTEDYAIYWPVVSATLNVNGGEITGYTGAIGVNAGIVNITGGIISTAGASSRLTDTYTDGTSTFTGNAALNLNGKYGKITCRISGGDFISAGEAVVISTGSTYPVDLKISGGRFSAPITNEDWLESGYVCATEPDKDGLYVVAKLQA